MPAFHPMLTMEKSTLYVIPLTISDFCKAASGTHTHTAKNLAKTLFTQQSTATNLKCIQNFPCQFWGFHWNFPEIKTENKKSGKFNENFP